MDYEEIKSLTKHHTQVFGRTVKCEMYKLEENRQLALHSHNLTDTCYAFNRASADDEVRKRARKKVEEANRKREAIEAVKGGK
jgi:hypothetical protein